MKRFTQFVGTVFAHAVLGVSTLIQVCFFGSRIDHECTNVYEFAEKFNFPRHFVPVDMSRRYLRERAAMMNEEIGEFISAIEAQDLAGQADALIDLVYFAKGTAVALGLPWEKLWDDVHRANMEKVPGMTKRGFGMDVTKPYGWEPPRTLEILQDNGYVFTRDENGNVVIADGVNEQ